MATRLYPATNDQGAIEYLAGVAPGTTTVLEDLEARASSLEDYEAYKLVNDNESAGALSSFKLFGWGRLQVPAVRIVQGAGLDPVCGSTEDPTLVRAIGNAQGLSNGEIETLVRTGGCYWT